MALRRRAARQVAPATRQTPQIHPGATPAAASTGPLKPAVIGALVVAIAIIAWIALKPGAPSAPLRDDVPHATPQDSPDVAPQQTPPTKPELTTPKPAAAPHILHLRAGQEARLKDNRATCLYKVLSVQMDRSRPDTLSLSVTVRVTIEGPSGAPRLYSRGPSGVFGETRRSMSSFAKASEDTRCAFLHGLTAVASCVGG
jgi:hypothetical protein